MSVRSGVSSYPARGVVVCTWTGLLNGDSGAYFYAPQYQNFTVQVYGTFGTGGKLTFQGDDGSGHPAALQDLNGNDLVDIAAAKVDSIGSIPTMGIRPIVTAGDGSTSLTAVVTARASK